MKVDVALAPFQRPRHIEGNVRSIRTLRCWGGRSVDHERLAGMRVGEIIRERERAQVVHSSVAPINLTAVKTGFSQVEAVFAASEVVFAAICLRTFPVVGVKLRPAVSEVLNCALGSSEVAIIETMRAVHR
jgi:hypothetical protein